MQLGLSPFVHVIRTPLSASTFWKEKYVVQITCEFCKSKTTDGGGAGGDGGFPLLGGSGGVTGAGAGGFGIGG